MANHSFIILGLLAFTCSVVLAFAGFCIADSINSALVNGRVSKDPKLAQAHDFFTGIHFPGNTLNSQGSKVTTVNIAHTRTQTLWHLLACVAIHRGMSTHHIFTLDSSSIQVLTVLEGTLYSASSNKNHGVITIANAMFGSNLSISSEVLTKAFQVDKNTVDNLQAQF